jgi:hypothetical protein
MRQHRMSKRRKEKNILKNQKLRKQKTEMASQNKNVESRK